MIDVIVISIILIGACFFLKSFKRSIYFICSFDILLRVLHGIADYFGKFLGEFSNFVNRYIPNSLPSIIEHYTSNTLELVLIGAYVIIFAIFEYYVLAYMFTSKR